MSDDAALLRLYAEEKSEAAFTELVHRHIDLVYAAALRRTGDAHRAQDVTQQVFATLARNARSLARHAVLGAWLHTATRNAALNLMISEQRRTARERMAMALETAGGSDSHHIDWQKLRPLLDAAIDELPAMDRAAVVAHFLEHRSFAEVGAALNLSADAARMRVHRALEKLHALLARRGISSTGAALGLALTQEAVVAAPTGLATSVVAGALTEVANAGALGGITAFMTATKTTIALGILAVAATVTALYQTQLARGAAIALDASRNDLAALRREETTLSAQTRAEEDALAAAKAAARETVARTAAAEAANNQAAAQAAALEKQKAADQALQQFLAADPELQELKRQHRLQASVRLLLPFALSLDMTPGELEQVAAEFNRWGPVYLPIHPANLEGMPSRLKDDPRFIEAWKNSDARFTVENFNMTLWEPLNATQAGRLIQSIQAARPSPIPPDGYNVQGIQRTADWARVLTEAGDYLSPSQMSALRGFAASARAQALLAIAAKQSQP